MIIIKNKAALAKMRTAGQLLAHVMEEAKTVVKAGISTLDIDAAIEQKMRAVGLKPELKFYPRYKHTICISVNDAVIHGVPSAKFLLKDGDFVKIDVVGSYKDYCADMARPFFVGTVNPVAHHMATIAQQALDAGLSIIKPGIKLSDISHTVQQVVETAGYNVLRNFAGHGIGKSLHEEPQILNYGKPGRGPLLQEGMTIAIEPMITEKGHEAYILKDTWTVKTVDGGLGAHVEDTIAITSNGIEILTRLT